ncbi:MAG: dCTP deaminase domain-containing protein [Candidatus Woesearchaeota archaeon]
MRLSTDKTIREEIEKGNIKLKGTFSDEQIQPGTLDVTIDSVKIYDLKYQKRLREYTEKLSLREKLNFEPPCDLAETLKPEKDEPFVVPPSTMFEVEITEDPEYDKNTYDVKVDLRSSRGRLGLRLDKEYFIEEDGRKFISVWNHNPNPIILYGHSKFAQLFFHPRNGDGDGYVVTNPDEAKNLAEMICETPEMLDEYFVFSAAEKLRKFKKHFGQIDTAKKYGDEEIYDIYDLNSEHIIYPGEVNILTLDPKIDLGSDVGLKMLQSIPLSQQSDVDIRKEIPAWFFYENWIANAKWIDPGYSGRVTAHPFARKFPYVVKKGMPFALALFYKYNTSVEREYGSCGLGSHYQGSDGTGSRS